MQEEVRSLRDLAHDGTVWFTVGAFVILGIVGVTVVNSSLAQQSKAHAVVAVAPDWTIAPCSWWAGESDPVLPPYTIANECVTDIGTISYAPSPTDHTIR